MSCLCQCFGYICRQRKQRRNGDNRRNASKRNPQPKVYAKDSMDRYGDDLCQLLLSYLPFEDRFEFEGVSKQWQRLIYETIVEIVIDDQMVSEMSANKTVKYWFFWVEFKAKPNQTQLFMTSMFNKCPNIQSIDIRCDVSKAGVMFKLLAQLKTNYPYLREIRFRNNELDENLAQFVFTTFGQMITEISISEDCDHIKYINECHKLTSLSSLPMDLMFSPDGQLLAKNLNTLFTVCENWTPIERYLTVIDHNMSLCFLYLGIHGIIDSANIVRKIMAQLSRLAQLRELYIHINPTHSLEYSLCDSLKTIGQMCGQLKTFTFRCKHYSEYRTEILKSIQFMTHLKRLHFSYYEFNATEINGMLESMNRWPQLIDLKFKSCDLKYQLFQQIELNLPKLQHLVIYDLNGRINSLWLERLATLSHLKTLSIRNTTEKIRYMRSGLTAITKKCRKLRSIEITNSNGEMIYKYL